jgi:hypothetical protein
MTMGYAPETSPFDGSRPRAFQQRKDAYGGRPRKQGASAFEIAARSSGRLTTDPSQRMKSVAWSPTVAPPRPFAFPMLAPRGARCILTAFEMHHNRERS